MEESHRVPRGRRTGAGAPGASGQDPPGVRTPTNRAIPGPGGPLCPSTRAGARAAPGALGASPASPQPRARRAPLCGIAATGVRSRRGRAGGPGRAPGSRGVPAGLGRGRAGGACPRVTPWQRKGGRRRAAGTARGEERGEGGEMGEGVGATRAGAWGREGGRCPDLGQGWREHSSSPTLEQARHGAGGPRGLRTQARGREGWPRKLRNPEPGWDGQGRGQRGRRVGQWGTGVSKDCRQSRGGFLSRQVSL